MPRFLKDANGTYDLLSVSAVTPDNRHGHAVLHFDGGQNIPTVTPYETAVSDWAEELDEELPVAAPVVDAEKPAA